MPGATGRALISNQYIDCTQAGQIPAATRQSLGPGTIAYSISETAFTIQFGGYQPAPILYLDFAWSSRNHRVYSRRKKKERERLGLSAGINCDNQDSHIVVVLYFLLFFFIVTEYRILGFLCDR